MWVVIMIGGGLHGKSISNRRRRRKIGLVQLHRQTHHSGYITRIQGGGGRDGHLDGGKGL